MAISPDFHFFADFAEMQVTDREGRPVGSIWDVPLSSEPYPRATHLILRKGLLISSYVAIAWDRIDKILATIQLNVSNAELSFQALPPSFDFMLVRDILDQQVVDTNGQKVLRVNDVHLLQLDRELRVSHVDISLRAIVRRLGWQWIVDRFVEIFLKRTDYFKENLINWRYVQPLAINPQKGTLRLSINQKQLSSIPHADFSDIMQNMDINQRLALFNSINSDFRPKVFSDFGLELQKEVLENLDLREAAELLARVPADQTADLLDEIPKAVSDSILALMETTQARRLSTLLGYTSDSAGGLMTTEMITLEHNAKVSDALAKIPDFQDHLDQIHHVYLVDADNRLMGQVPLKKLLIAAPDSPIIQYAFAKPIYVRVKDSLREVAFIFEKYKVPAVPVVNNGKERLLQGVITIDDILKNLVPIAWRRRPKTAA